MARIPTKIRKPKPKLATEERLDVMNAPEPAPAVSPTESARLTADVGPVQTARQTNMALEPKRGEYRNINFENIESEGGVKEFLDAVSYETENAGYRPQPHTDVAAKAAESELTIEQLLGGKKPGGLMNQEQLLRSRQLMVTSARRIQDKAQDIHTRRKRGDVSNAELLDFRRDLERHKALQAAVQGEIRDVARTLSALRIPAGDIGDDVMLDMISRTGGRDASFARAAYIAQSKDLADVSKRVDKGLGAKIADAAIHMRTMGLLSSPTTQVKNIVGNGLVNLFSIPERALAGAIGTVKNSGRKALGMPETEQVYTGEALAGLYGEASSLLDAIRLAGRAMKTNQSQFGSTKLSGAEADEFVDPISSAAFGVDPTKPYGKALDLTGAVISLPGRALLGGDEFFKTLSFNKELHAQAYRQATSEGVPLAQRGERMSEILKGVDEETILRNFGADDQVAQQVIKAEDAITRNAYAKAYQQAQYETFTDQLEWGPAKAIQQIQRTKGGRMVVPFYRTIANISSYAIERSPIAPIAPNWRRNFEAGGAQRDLALAQWGMGATLATAVHGVVADGKLTGAGPQNPQTRAMLEQEGWQPYSAMIDGQWVSYQGMEPATSLIAMMADAMDMVLYNDNPQIAEDMEYALVSAFAQSFMDQTFMMGVTDFTDALTSRNIDQFKNYVSRMAASFTPYSSATRMVKRLDEDAVKRNTWDSPFNTWHNHFAEVTPYMDSTAPPRRDMFGEVSRYKEKLGPDWLSPFYVSKYKNDMATQELIVQGVSIPQPRAVLSLGGDNVIDLREMEHPKGQGWMMDEWASILGRTRKKHLDKMVASAKYKNARDAESGLATEGTRAELLQKALTAANTDAKGQFIRQFKPELKWAIETQEDKTIVPKTPPGMERQLDKQVRF